MLPSAIKAFSALVALSGLAHAFPGVRDDPSPEVGPPANYGIVPIEWDIPTDPAAPDGATVELTGTIQEVVAKMDQDYPGWNESFHQHMRWTPPSDNTSAVNIGSANYDVDKLVCTERWEDMCFRQHIEDGIYYLMNLPAQAKPKNGPGPGNCGRVSCSWGDAIYWCNDNKEDKELNSWDALGIAAFKIWRECQYAPLELCGGQVFYKDNWNVIVKKDNC
ncbi:hypothetical protein QBC40DRAFT_260801 [Triangularia verruculosa]|uniref:Uncharacterized protein n=1 Tax=Triangularia verruculosa TaxID=2587418 RepID=A0AAN6XRI4_9PEZI|nr:hypothetical protein QBC40DRAFT_260801 [Triangularia verruculosa]